MSDSTMQLYYPIGEMLKGDLPRKDPDKIKPAVTPSSEHSSLTRQVQSNLPIAPQDNTSLPLPLLTTDRILWAEDRCF